MAKKTPVSKPGAIPRNKPAGDTIIKGGVPTMQNSPKPPPKENRQNFNC